MVSRYSIATGAVGGAFLVFCAAAAPPETLSWNPPLTIGAGAWSRMAPLTNGSWLLVHTVFPSNAPSQLRILQTTLKDRSWHPLAELVEPGRKFDNGNLLVLPDATVLLTGRSLIDEQSYHLPVYRSTNGGRNWSRIGNIDAHEGAPGSLKERGLWEPHLARLPDGRVTAFYSSEKHTGFSQIIAQKISPDRGAMWGPELRAVAQPGGGELRPGMPVLDRMTNGEWLLVYEVVGIGRGQVYFKRSPDAVNWPDGLGTPIAGHEAGPFVLASSDGLVVVTSCANFLSVSDNSGDSWRRLDPPPFPLGFRYSWPALYETRPGEISVTVSAKGIQLRSGTLPPITKP